MEALRREFRPEFLNRIDDVVFFHALGEDQIRQILDLQLNHLRALLEERKIGLQMTDAAMARLAEQGYDPVYGARPLKRAIQRELQNPLASALLAGRFSAGDTVVCDVVRDALTFEKAESTRPAKTIH
jgi:ATP-dependent Clp protease ATP-binding subunit ClpB